MLEWHVLHTKPHKEHQVESILGSRGIEVYFPTIATPRQGARASERAFFPCYLFARTDLDSVGLWGLQYLPGVRSVVMVGDTAACVNSNVIAAIKGRLESISPASNNRFVAGDSRGQILVPGDRVKITAGVFNDFEAVFDQRLSPNGRVRVLIQWLNRWSRVELQNAQIVKAGLGS